MIVLRNVISYTLTCPSRINLTQTNNFTVKSVKGVFYSIDSLIACRCNCCFQTICNSTCWQLNCTAVTLTRLFKKQTERNVTVLGIDKVICIYHQRTVRRLFRNQGTHRSEIGHSSCPVLFIMLENPIKVNAKTCVSMPLERWTNIFVTGYILWDQCSYDLFYCKVVNVQKFIIFQQRISNTTSCSQIRPRVEMINSATSSFVRCWFHAIWKAFLFFITTGSASNTWQPVMFYKNCQC